jgi:hypothetical protein
MNTFTRKNTTIGRAPKGGLEFNGRIYRGGQFCPLAAVIPPVCGGAPEAEELPILRGGSVKQAAYAEDLRARTLARWEKELATYRNSFCTPEELEADKAEYRAAIDFARGQDSCRFWLDYGDRSIDKVIALMGR